ncbi:MAG: hypothetical protein AAF667_07390 [Pseudomonadota bacterium]
MTQMILSGVGAGTEILFAQGAAFGGANQGNYTLTTFPATVTGAGAILVSENITFVLEGYDPDTDFIIWDFDDAGATYASGALNALDVNDASTGVGPVVAHAWATPGSKSVSYSVYGAGGTIRASGSISVDITDPAAVTWDVDLYISFAGNFTGAPAEGGAVVHVDSLTELETYEGASGNNARFHWRRGEVFDLAFTGGDFRWAPSIWVHSAFGTGARPVLRPNYADNGAEVSLFRCKPGTVTLNGRVRLAVDSVNFDGRYSPITGEFEAGRVQAFIMDSGVTSASLHFSAHNCDAVGLGGFIGESWPNDDASIAVTGCKVNDFANFGATCFARYGAFVWQGNETKQSPLATRGDGKTAPSDPNLPDHGPLRMHGVKHVGVTDCDLASTTGWSGGFGQTAVQPIIRNLYDAEFGQATFLGGILRNRCAGAPLLTHGCTNPSGNNSSSASDGIMVVEGNRYNHISQANALLAVQLGGLYVQNNVVYLPNIDSGYGGDYAIAVYPGGAPTGAGATNPVVVRNNTIVSDRTADSGGLVPVILISMAPWPGQNWMEEHNLVSVPNHPNASEFTDHTPLSPGENFRPVTGSAAIGGIAANNSLPKDFSGHFRGQATSIGAHQTGTTTVIDRSAPINTTPPTIASVPSVAGEAQPFAMVSFGDWSQDFEPYQVEWEWRVDGVAVGAPDRFLTRFDVGGVGGAVSLALIATNESGVRTVTVSNEIVI